MVRIPYKYRPGWGFLFLVASILFALAFYFWGRQTPALDRVWTLEARAAADPALQFDAEDMEVLEAVSAEYPTLIKSWLDGKPWHVFPDGRNLRQGWNFVLVNEGPALKVRLRCEGPAPDATLSVPGLGGSATLGKVLELPAVKKGAAWRAIFAPGAGAERTVCGLEAR